MENKWWQKEVVYQIYPRSFYDSNNDGIGDINGITEKLDYLKNLGITSIWICPFFKSPMDDNGYDISDYEDINPEFGTMEDVENLITKAAGMGIKVIFDLVLNHTSDEHPWFVEALNNPESKYRNYYIFKEGKNGNPPTNWRSVFGGSVWQKVNNEDNMFYMHSFSKKQPDLNWENPEMRQDLYDIIGRWAAKGVAGFRVDAINFIKKNQDWPDGEVDGADGLASCFPFTRNVEGIDVFFDDMKTKAFDYYNVMSVSEAVGVEYKDAGHYVGDEGYFSMMFDFNYTNFDVINEDYFHINSWKPKDLKELIYTSQIELQKLGWSAPFIENHDQPRAVNKWIKNPAYHTYIGPACLAVLYFNLRGTPFIYQGQELGQLNFTRKSIDEFDDLNAKSQYERALQEGFSQEQALRFLNNRSRDNARTPFHWNDEINNGFSLQEPWIKMNEQAFSIHAASQIDDENSVFSFYKKLIWLRQKSQYSDDLVFGDFKVYEQNNDNVISYIRNDKVYVLVSLSDQEELVDFDLSNKKILINNYPDVNAENSAKLRLHPYQAIMLAD